MSSAQFSSETQMTRSSEQGLAEFSHSVLSDSLWPHGLQHARLTCPSSTPEACSNSCPLSQWCCLTISSSVVPFSSCPQSFPASVFFPMSPLFPSGSQSIGASASASVLPVNIQGWFPLGLIGLISLLSVGLSRVFSSTTVGKHQFFVAQPSLQSNSHIYNLIYCSPNVTHYARHPGLKQNETSLLPSEGLQNHGRSINTKLLCDRKRTTYMDAEVPSLRVNALKIL